ncbi:SLC13 family permease [Agaribacter marinus]|uniref:SLC13 family permease n=1 Tax=Virgibacillus salarius TaxID=447199 RepID=A0A941IBZ4_9BACI|nr:SLC13 family permease [Virgibacillus salarius]MBR7796877.1 SLC13 family permease [Virgibacillus salarius]NAZ09587.1 SLC13 family permease [Agaribacter marinus]
MRIIRSVYYKSYKKIYWLSFVLVICCLVLLLVKDAMATHFTAEQLRTLFVLGIAVYLWVADPIPTGAGSILIIALLMVFQLADSMEEAVVGFLSPAIYFIFMLSIISQVLIKAGVDGIVAQFLLKMSKGGPKFIIIGLPLFSLLLPVLLPSAVARFKMLLPLIDRLNDYFALGEQSPFRKYGIHVIGMINQHATMIVYTGGGFPILASQLLRDYQIADLGWLDWFLLMAPPIWIGSILTLLFVYNYISRQSRKISYSNVPSSTSSILKEDQGEPSKQMWIVSISFFVMVLTWVVTDPQQVPLLLPPMLLVVFYAIPKIDLVTNSDIRKLDWENFLLLGASFSLGSVLETNGTASQLAQLLMKVVPEGAGVVLSVSIIAIMVFILRFFFIVPSSAIIVIFPVVMSYSHQVGLPPVPLALLIIMIVGSMIILPIHTTTTYLASQTLAYSRKEQVIIGLFSSTVFFIIAILAALYFW